MKINTNYQNFQLKNNPQKNLLETNHQISPDVIVDIKKIDNFTIRDNNPKDPTVATKVLDGLKSGIINFSQDQRDTIAKVLSHQAELASEITNENPL